MTGRLALASVMALALLAGEALAQAPSAAAGSPGAAAAPAVRRIPGGLADALPGVAPAPGPGSSADPLAPVGVVPAAAPPPAPAIPLSSAAEAVYAEARPRLLQIRTLVRSAGGQATIGSGFLVGGRGFALTNYHVVSQFALEPATYRLEYVAPDGTTGPLELHAVDVANDLAVVELDHASGEAFVFDERAVRGELPKGERLFAMGNPLDLGFTIVEGTYNGLVDKSYNERIHFSGALNPGMSGGPTVTVQGRVAGVNVAKQIGGDLVSFLVPARHAAALLERAESSGPMTPEQAHDEIGRQLVAWQRSLYAAMGERGFRTTSLGPYAAPQSAAAWFSCWSRTNAGDTPKPRALANQTSCSTQASLFVAGDLETGQVDLSHAFVRSVDLNPFQFAAYVSDLYRYDGGGGGRRKRLTPAKCHEDFVTPGAPAERPLLRVVWCARAYRDFEGLYDVSITAVTQDRSREALVSRLSMRGAAYDNAQAFGRRFLDGIGFAR